MEYSRLKELVPENVLNQILRVRNLTPLRLCHFLAQCAHESASFTIVTENLNYGAAGLLKTFPKYFDAITANIYARKPEQIANRVYAGRMGNGPETSGDGYRYRGRGYIQLTGFNNYNEFTKYIGGFVEPAKNCITNPDLVATTYPLASAAFFFERNGLWLICDKGATDADVTAVTKRVNGGIIGLDDRLKKFKLYSIIL